MYGISRSRSTSATTSLPNPAALVPEGIGRSTAAVSTLPMSTFPTSIGLVSRGGTSRVDMGILSGLTRLMRMEADPSGSGALTQPGQHLEAGIAVGGRLADFSLKVAHRTLGVAANPAVAAVGVETERGEAALQFLHLHKRHKPLAARER